MKPLNGIRLAFVDMELASAGTMREILGKTVNVLKKSIASDTAPVMFVAWTQNDNYIDEFRTMLGEAMPKLRPLFVLPMPKPFTKTGRIKSSQVVRDVNRLLKDRSPLGVLWLWEQMSHDAATVTTQAIADLVTARNNSAQPPAEWKTSLSEILRLLLATGAGQNEDMSTVSQGLLEVLNSLHLDGLEHLDASAYRKEINPIRKLDKPELSTSQMAKLNSMLLLSPADPTDSTVKPGNVYLPSKISGLGCPHALCVPDVEGLMNDVLSLKKDGEYKRLSDQLNSKSDAAAKRGFKRKLRTQFTSLMKQCRVTLVEVTAPCDFSQQTRSVSRFVAGLLVPELLGKLIKDKKESSRRLEAVQIPGLDGIWSLVLSARFPYVIGKPEKLIKVAPLFRLRNSVVIDIQAWLAAQSARPGYVSLR
ncbi:MAG TPA: hypothetical protein VGO56_13280 [Pyrinomonadaceae bacterium]|nr:hypothetical protein [Pyrinomonadaceae bacterium]